MPDHDIETFVAKARAWLEEVAPLRASEPVNIDDEDVSVFHHLTFDDERELLDRAMEWQQGKLDAGFGAITWPAEHGGAGLTHEYEEAFRREEAEFVTPVGHETFSVTVGLVAATIREFGTAEQHRQFVRRFLRAEELCCQLFSEPDAGSDLASVRTRAVQDGDGWVINGQKVWSSGAQFSGWGELVARTGSEESRHRGLTVFLIPMDAPGVEVRPIRQMSGGSSFSEVFLNDVRIPDTLRLGPVGDGWKVALTTLGFERAGSGGGREVGGSWEQLLSLARRVDATRDPVQRQALAHVYTTQRIRSFVSQRVEHSAQSRRSPGPEGSIGKLLWTRGMTEIGGVASALLGPRLVADSGVRGTWCWTEHVLGAPGYRIAGGSDEIQRNIIAERVLGLPKDAQKGGDRG